MMKNSYKSADCLLAQSPVLLTEGSPLSLSGNERIFSDSSNRYISHLELFLFYFKVIPNYILEEFVNCQKAVRWFADRYEKEMLDHHYNIKCNRSHKGSSYDDIYFILPDKILVYFDTQNHAVKVLYKTDDLSGVREILQGIEKCRVKIRRDQPQISLLLNNGKGLDIETMDIKKPRLRLEDNYNDDFLDVHKAILQRLSKNNDKGLVLLHGKPGTGKTSYIRYLATRVKKTVIFLPPNMAEQITNPGLMTVLVNNPNSILVIEDAENILMDREHQQQSPVSALLNLCDGLLSDCLNIQVVCSFNTDLSRLDNALLRKGRLIARYAFEALDTHKAQALSDKLGYHTTIFRPMTLTDVYNQDEKSVSHAPRKTSIGFKTVSVN